MTASHEKTVSAAPRARRGVLTFPRLSRDRARDAKRRRRDESAKETQASAEADKENGEKPAPKRRGRAAGGVNGKSPPAETKAPRALAEASPARANETEPEQPASSGKKSTRAERAEARAAATGEASGGGAGLQARLGKTSPASVSREGPRREGPEADVIEIDLISPASVAGKEEASAAKAAKAVKAKTPAPDASNRGDGSQPSSRGPTTRSAGKSASGSKRPEDDTRAAAVSARGAGKTPGRPPADVAATPVAATPETSLPAKTPEAEKSFGKKLAAVANEANEEKARFSAARLSAAEAEAPLFSNALFEASARKQPTETRVDEEETAAPAELPEPEPEAPPPLPKLAPDLMTSFVPLAGYEEKPAAPASEKKAESRLGALRQAEAAKKAETRREEERRARKEAMMAARQAATAAKPKAAPSPAAPAVGAGGAAAGSVMERLQRAMESRSRLEAENRAKLEADQKRVEEERRRREADAEERRRQKEAEEAREREEKKQRQEKMLKMRKEQEEARREVEEKQARVRRLLEEQDRAKAAGAASVGAKRKSGATPARIDSAEEKKRRLQSFMANNRANAALAANGGAPGATAVAAKLTNADPPARDASAARTPSAKPALSGAPAEFSYQISPYRENSDSESEEDDARPRKPIPGWAQSDQLAPCLYRQAKVDPDEIFVNPSKTCSLDAVFAARASSKSRRSSSGNWFHDRLTWKEEVSYKREMGFIGAAEL